tara:strand:+ start:1362 stop:1679 length:318 start_codon:yes stop_codon:yes gene_type:complete
MTEELSLKRTVKVIQSRRSSDKSKSYVASLLQGNTEHLLKKLTEETTELILAVNSGQPQEVVHEAADLLFHYLVLLEKVNISLGDVINELTLREGVSGIQEKQSR